MSLASWNVQGLKSKSLDKCNCPTFMSEIRKHHIISIQETHCSPDTYIKIPGYQVHQMNRPKSGNKKHGGIAILVKGTIKNGVQFLKPTSHNILWIQLKKEFFSMSEDIFIGAIYISPSNSSFSKRNDIDNPYEEIEKEMSKYISKGKCILMGDFNSRTSTLPDFVVNDNIKYVPVPNSYIADKDLLKRRSEDCEYKNCKYGGYLLEFCKKN